jgi:flavin-dependent dehydrogenase
MPEQFDVAVLGGGPAGLAAALRLHRLGHRAVLLERSRYERPRAGETFGVELAPLLEELGIWEEFLAAGPLQVRGVRSAWGTHVLAERASIFHPYGEGWHVERNAFDKQLAAAAELAGVRVEAGCGAPELSREDGVWRLRCSSGALAGEPISARYLVDASGRGAPATAPHVQGRRWLQADRLVALLGPMTGPDLFQDPLLVIESVPEGWWYSVPQQDGGLLVALITDADLLPARSPQALSAYFTGRLEATSHTSARTAGGQLLSAPWIVRADSGLLLPARGDGWFAAGDAAHSSDPLSGDGVVRAMRSAAEVAEDLDLLLRGERLKHKPGVVPLPQRFRRYLELRDRYCAAEERYPDSPFWARRRPIDWQGAPLLLEPKEQLSWTGAAPSPEACAPIEALLTADGLREALALLKQRTPAFQTLRTLGALVPFEPRRLLVGLQMLHAIGVAHP